MPYGKKNLLYAQKRPTDILAYLRYAYAQVSKEAYHMAKETYYTHKRDLLILAYLRSAGTRHKCPERPMNLSKEATNSLSKEATNRHGHT